jgi:hypothetical protein
MLPFQYTGNIINETLSTFIVGHNFDAIVGLFLGVDINFSMASVCLFHSGSNYTERL